MKAIGIEVGLAAIRAVVIDSYSGKLLMSKQIPGAGFMESPEDWEKLQDPTVIVKKTMDLLEELLGNYPDFSAIGLTGQMKGIVYLDEGGHYVTPLYTSKDERGSLPLINGKSIPDLLRNKYGINLSAGSGLATHLYNARQHMIPSEAVTFCTIMDYIGMKMTGRTKPLVHASNAAGFGLFNAGENDFEKQVFEAMGGDSSFLPEVTREIRILGNFRGIPVVTTAVGDDVAGFLGAVGDGKGKVVVQMGTGSHITMVSDRYVEIPWIRTIPFIDGKYLLSGFSRCGVRTYELLERFFREYMAAAGLEAKPQYDTLNRLVSMVSDTGGMEIKASIRETRHGSNFRGRIGGLTEHNFTPAYLTRGLIESMIQELYDEYMLIVEKAGLKADEIIGYGMTLHQGEAFQEIFQQKFHLPMQLSPYKDDTVACGAAISAQMAVQASGN